MVTANDLEPDILFNSLKSLTIVSVRCLNILAPHGFAQCILGWVRFATAAALAYGDGQQIVCSTTGRHTGSAKVPENVGRSAPLDQQPTRPPVFAREAV